MAASLLGWERVQGQEDTPRAGQSEQLQITALGLTKERLTLARFPEP